MKTNKSFSAIFFVLISVQIFAQNIDLQTPALWNTTDDGTLFLGKADSRGDVVNVFL